MFIHQELIPGLAAFSYVLADETTKQAFVIDPVRDVDVYLDIAKANAFNIVAIMETHVHADFVSGAKELKSRLGELSGQAVKIYCSGYGGKDWTPPYVDVLVDTDMSIAIGGLIIEPIHTPGHTLEHLVWTVKEEGQAPVMFSGDFLFVGDVGRPDLLGEEAQKTLAKQLYHSVFSVLPQFPDEMIVYPGHGAGSLCGKKLGSTPSTTIGEQRASNPALIAAEEDRWIANLMNEMPVPPPYFPRMKKVNVEGVSLVKDLPLGGENDRELQVIDTRPWCNFSAAHFPKALHIPTGTVLNSWIGWLGDYDKEIALVCAPETCDADIDALWRLGFEHITPVTMAEMEELLKGMEGELPAAIKSVSAQEFKTCRTEVSFDGVVIDVRSKTEQAHAAYRGDGQVMEIALGELNAAVDRVPRDKPLYVLCAGGTRAHIGTSILASHEYDAMPIEGGLGALEG